MLVIFYEKPGCITNAKQKKQLRQAGCIVIERNLLDHDMDKEMLGSFFEGKAVNEWFNPNAPKIKSGEIDPMMFDEHTALELLMKEPILIRRPLMIFGGKRVSGFPEVFSRVFEQTSTWKSSSDSCSNSQKKCCN